MRIELTPSAWKAEVLPLNYIRIKNWSGRRDSNSRPSPWQGDALPLSHFRIIGRGRWIRTIESSANGFTVRPLWPLGNPSKFCLPDYYIIIYEIVQQNFFVFIKFFKLEFCLLLELVEGISQMLRICRSCHGSAWLRTSRCFKVHRTSSLRSSPFGFDSLCWSWWRESNPQPADYKSAALPLSHTSIFIL